MPFWEHFYTKPKQRNLQEGLFQIASQTCNLLVQVNNTNNITIGSNTLNINCNGNGILDMEAVAKQATSLQQEITHHQETTEQLVLLLPNGQKSAETVPAPFDRARQSVCTFFKGPKINNVLDFPALTNEEESDLWHHGYAIPTGYDNSPSRRWGSKNGWCKPSCIPISVICILIFLVVLLPVLNQANERALQKLNSPNNKLSCNCNCSILKLVESIPEGMTYSNDSIQNSETFKTWSELLDNATKTVEIAAFYWTLRQEDVYPDPSSKEGEIIFEKLLKMGTEGKVKIKIAQNAPSAHNPSTDSEILVKRKAAEVRNLNFNKLMGGGVLHTKFWIIDRRHFYVGSANMDWRSLTQVKEMGIVGFDCPCLANDLAKVFEVYWSLGRENAQIPKSWPKELATNVNMSHPMNISTDSNGDLQVYLTSSPPPFSPLGRTDDIKAIVNIIETAEKFVYIAVMDYFPLMIYGPKVTLWPVIDNALRAAAIERKVEVRLLISWWKHSRSSEDYFLRSLADLTDSYPRVTISVRRFIVPATPEQQKIPFGRVNHNKYMVTDNTAYIGTSNWSGDYFVNTAGVAVVVQDSNGTLRDQLQAVFERDWNSNYSHPLQSF